MTNIERKRFIIEQLNTNESVRVDELAAELGVTRVTIRSDIADLERRGLAIRSRGVVLTPEHNDTPRYVSNTINENLAAKEAIARQARKMLSSGATVVLDGGSTNAIFARRLRDLPLTVVTNSIPVVVELSTAPEVDLLVSGGSLRKPSMSTVGEFSRTVYEHIHPDFAFVGASGYTVAHGPSAPNLLEAETKRAIIACAQTVCVLVDSSKFGVVSMAAICDWESVDFLITDAMEPDIRGELEALGVEVVVAAS